MKNARFLALGTAAMAIPAALAQPVALDTFGPGNSYETGMFLNVRGSQAVSTPRNAHATLFTAQETGAVDHIMTVLRHVDGANDFTVQIRTGDANQVGPALGSWQVQAGSSAQPIITIPVGGSVQLNAGQTYYIVAIGHGTAEGAWHQNDQNMFTNGWATSSNEGFTFFLVNGTRLPAVRITLEGDPPCYPDCDENQVLNVDDFICFINAFAQSDPYADCDGNTLFNVDDFICFINEFAQGCP
jgi:hypothetical protein